MNGYAHKTMKKGMAGRYRMKIDRMSGILSILLQQDKVTAPYLAEKFEVSLILRLKGKRSAS